jgi:hypothetical protein
MTQTEFLTTKYLDQCEDGELLRLENGRWAIAVNSSRRALVTFSRGHVPTFIGADDTEALTMREGSCCSYGKNFRVLPEYAGSCEVWNVSTKINHAPGGLIYCTPQRQGAKTEPFLVVAQKEGSPAFLNLSTFTPVEEPSGYRARFANWGIWMILPSLPDQPTRLFEYGQEA